MGDSRSAAYDKMESEGALKRVISEDVSLMDLAKLTANARETLKNVRLTYDHLIKVRENVFSIEKVILEESGVDGIRADDVRNIIETMHFSE